MHCVIIIGQANLTLTLTLSYDLELERQGSQGGLAAADRDKTVNDGHRGVQADAVAVAFHVPCPRDSFCHRLAEFFGHGASLIH